MTKASEARKNRKKSGDSRAPNSFANMVGQAQTNALKPYVDQVVGQAINQMAIPMFQQITKLTMDHIGQVQNRILAFERLLDVDKDKLAAIIADIEDEALGFVPVEGASEAGHTVRVSMVSKEEGAEEFGAAEKVLIPELLKEDANGNVQTLKELEEGLLGAKVGETKEILVPALDETSKGSVIQATVIRISKKKEEANAE